MDGNERLDTETARCDVEPIAVFQVMWRMFLYATRASVGRFMRSARPCQDGLVVPRRVLRGLVGAIGPTPCAEVRLVRGVVVVVVGLASVCGGVAMMWGAASAEPAVGTAPSSAPAASPGAGAPAADPAQGQVSLVEDCSYPGAEEIARRRDIRLVSGDGRITLVGCGGPGLIEVRRSGARKDSRASCAAAVSGVVAVPCDTPSVIALRLNVASNVAPGRHLL
ncbi:MAG: hypothetical protein HOV94_38165 [Saccharothrix sp.]|nr:hypothetical protein [Saccharothrix sp.]